MPDIRYVCLSDMHLGADNSILTAIKPESIETDTSRPSAVMTQLVLCLRELIAHNEGAEKPTLVLNGDILEMALTDVNKAAMVFERFIELVFPRDGEAIFKKDILFFPGNHDHHVWESARETGYLHYIRGLQPGDEIGPPDHTTKMFCTDFVREPFLTNLLHIYPHLQDATVNIAYPNYALLSHDGQKSVIFSHGHYVESIYSLMTSLNTMVFPDRIRPSIIWELEAENFAWVDFFWSTLGRSGDVGQDIGIFYAKLQDNKQVEKLISNFINNWLAHTKQFRLLEGVEERGLAWVANFIFNKLHPLEKQRVDHSLSADALRGLQWFTQGVLLEQLKAETSSAMPADIAFLFGHTHKPFQEEMSFSGYTNTLKVYNSGGWVVDTVDISPRHGAAVLLVDEMLDTVSLRMYNQAVNPGDYAVSVNELTRPGTANSAFYARVNAAVNNARDPWKTFSAAAAEAVGVHAHLLKTKINM